MGKHTAQLVQTVDPVVPAKFPTAHAKHTVAPVTPMYMPVGQRTQADMPLEPPYFPAWSGKLSQCMQASVEVVMISKSYLSHRFHSRHTSHGVHAIDPAIAYVPAKHWTGAVDDTAH